MAVGNPRNGDKFFLILALYNGKRGKGMKWLFYIYYPAHLVLIGILRLCLLGNVGVMIGA